MLWWRYDSAQKYVSLQFQLHSYTSQVEIPEPIASSVLQSSGWYRCCSMSSSAWRLPKSLVVVHWWNIVSSICLRSMHHLPCSPRLQMTCYPLVWGCRNGHYVYSRGTTAATANEPTAAPADRELHTYRLINHRALVNNGCMVIYTCLFAVNLCWR